MALPNPAAVGMGASNDLGLTMMDGRNPMDILEEQRKKRIQQQQQASMPRPYMGAAQSLLNPAGNQY
jgi:hypothetical protein